MTRLSQNPLGDRFPTHVVGEPGAAAFDVVVDYGRAEILMGRKREGTATLEKLDSHDQRKGIGTHLVLVAAQEAIARGGVELYAGIIDERAMRIFGRLFGEQSLFFVEERPDGDYELPLTLSEAIASIALADAMYEIFQIAEIEEPEDFDPGIATYVDLTNPGVRARIGLPPIETGPGTGVTPGNAI
jgi:hypothetical protein